MNTLNRTVKGQIEGESGNVETMKKWLQTNGSPSSRIDEAVFSCEKEIKMQSPRRRWRSRMQTSSGICSVSINNQNQSITIANGLDNNWQGTYPSLD